MSPDELREIIGRLRRQGQDDALVEAKSCGGGLSKDVWESVSAFGNTHGGTLLLGIDEKANFQQVEHFPLEKIRNQFVEGMGDGGAAGKKVENPPQYDLERVDFEGGQILVVELEEVEHRFKPCYVSSKGLANGSYKRIDDMDVKLSATEVYELQHMLEISEADREGVKDAVVGDLDATLVDALIASEKERGSKALRGTHSEEEALRQLSVATSHGEITLAGLMCLGRYPQRFFPKLTVDVTAHPGIEKSEPGEPRFIDRVICEGPLAELVDDALLAVTKNLRTFSFVEGSGRRDELEIPREVLREAIANAVIHREYGNYFTGQSVSVDVYPDRVEIINPGGLWGGKTLQTLADGQSRCRNATIMRLASRIQRPKGGAPAEGQGSGIPLMIRLMRSHALDDPRFDAGIDYFKVTLQRGGAEISKNREWLGDVAGDETSIKEESVLLELRRRGSATVRDLRERLGYDSDEIREIAEVLTERSLVVENPADTYYLVDEAFQGKPARKATARNAILEILREATEPLGIREIAELSGKKLSTLRAQMSALVAEGIVTPTAPATDRTRKYQPLEAVGTLSKDSLTLE